MTFATILQTIAWWVVFFIGCRSIIRSAYLCIKKNDPVMIVAVSLKNLPEGKEDIQALRVTYSSDAMVEMTYLDLTSLRAKLQTYSHRRIYLHIGCHCWASGVMQFDTESVTASDLVDIMPRGGVDTIALMCCYGGQVAPYLLGENAAKNVVYTEYDKEIESKAASAVTRVFWQELKNNYGRVRTAYRQTHKRLPRSITDNIRLSTFRKNKLF